MLHHLDYKRLAISKSKYTEYAAIISIADRADILMNHPDKFSDSDLERLNTEDFSPQYYRMLVKAQKNRNIAKNLLDGSFREKIEEMIKKLNPTDIDVFAYLRMLVYSIDFRSEFTVSHTINTTAISVELAKLMHFSDSELAEIYYGALLHDMGKIAIPLEILESPNRLTVEEMYIMKTHVERTDDIIRGVVSNRICDIAVRHHEKLDGSGYPYGLTGDVLTPAQRIVAVADIVSALSGIRSYKEPFPKEKIMEILKQMRDDLLLCPIVTGLVLENYDRIMYVTDASRDPVIKLYLKLMEDYTKPKMNIENYLPIA